MSGWKETTQNPLNAETAALSIDDVSRFLTAKGWDDVSCNVCGNHPLAFRVVNDEPLIVTSMHREQQEGVSWFFSMLCPSCGDVRFIDASVVTLWIRENPDE